VSKSSAKPVFTANHTDWHKTFTKEKQRYMTCRGEPANYDTTDYAKDIGAKFSQKFTVSKEIRATSCEPRAEAPGPGS